MLPYLDQNSLMDRLNGIKNLGTGWVRFDVDWSDVQGDGPNNYDWSNYDRLIAGLNATGIKGLGIIDYTPRWARSKACLDSEYCAPADSAQFANFAQAVVKRYAPQGMHTWEIWNEPNLEYFWQPQVSPAAYAELVKKAYVAIKTQDPSAIVIAGSLNSRERGDGNISSTDFMAQFYAAGAKNYFDAVSIHPYCFPTMPSSGLSWTGWAAIQSAVPSVRSVMADNGDGAKQIWLTEFGAPTGGPGNAEASNTDTDFDSNPDHVTEALQAQMLGDAITDYKKMSPVGPLFFYSYQDDGVTSDTVENFFGLLRYDGSAKPAYNAVKSLITSNP